ncbi:MAG TPA: DUF2145 domain-containing protein [Ramlibacter sp.]|uniref:DUF2145 domain-containing protein n=1 Tax=Ramlibacter sp. TaxID=1917967 RepID=UPI002BB65678|nr:DUF2145 domain-containing protein [Ramlibacter sp.]HVZ43792.1 DUF2145 domain-containing protein [Ramlibacter sp.]
MKTAFWRAMCALLLAAVVAAPARAGRTCEPWKPSAATLARAFGMAERTLRALDDEYAKNGTQVVVLARAGQDLTQYGLRYSHLGFAYRTADGRWRVLHKLNQCGTADASIYRQGLGDFFLDSLWRYEAAYEVPAPEVQARLLAVLQDERRATAMHWKPYSVVSYAWGQRYQQSNQWAIETLAAAMEPGIASRTQAQAWLQFKGYQPTTLHLGPMERLGGRLTSANVAFDDHPSEKRFSNRIETVTVDSVFDWLPRAGLASSAVTLRP